MRGASRGLLGASGELAQELAPELAQELAPEQAPEEEGKVFTASFEFTGYSEGAEVPAAAPVPAPGPGYFFYSSGPAEGPAADDFETDESGEPCESTGRPSLPGYSGALGQPPSQQPCSL